MTPTTNLLHPRQVSEYKDLKARLEGMLAAPAHIRGQLQDGGAGVSRQIGELDKMLQQAPIPYEQHEIDEAVKLEESLRDNWLLGMPTQAEMRRNPPGATDKHRAWDSRCKTSVLQWKHVRRRLHASGISEHRLADEGDISNVEMFRPVGGSQEMNLGGAQIEGKTMKLPPPGVGPAAVMTEQHEKILNQIDPTIVPKMGLLPNDTRSEILDAVREFAKTTTVSVVADPGLARMDADDLNTQFDAVVDQEPKKKTREWTSEQRASRSAHMKRVNEDKRRARENAPTDQTS